MNLEKIKIRNNGPDMQLEAAGVAVEATKVKARI
jgi:hypothetical protein